MRGVHGREEAPEIPQIYDLHMPRLVSSYNNWRTRSIAEWSRCRIIIFILSLRAVGIFRIAMFRIISRGGGQGGSIEQRRDHSLI